MDVRLARPADAAAMAAIYRPYVMDTAVSFEEEAPSADELWGRVEAHPQLPWLVVESDAIEGFAYASPHRSRSAYRWSIDVSVYLPAVSRRRGLGRRLYRSLLGLVAEQGYVTANAGITLPNAASVGFHEAMGFEPVGVYRAVGYKHGAWRDVGWWQRPLGALPDHPPEPVPVAGIDDAVVAHELAP